MTKIWERKSISLKFSTTSLSLKTHASFKAGIKLALGLKIHSELYSPQIATGDHNGVIQVFGMKGSQVVVSFAAALSLGCTLHSGFSSSPAVFQDATWAVNWLHGSRRASRTTAGKGFRHLRFRCSRLYEKRETILAVRHQHYGTTQINVSVTCFVS